jgi:hypothetical protein
MVLISIAGLGSRKVRLLVVKISSVMHVDVAGRSRRCLGEASEAYRYRLSVLIPVFQQELKSKQTKFESSTPSPNNGTQNALLAVSEV